MSGGHFNYSQYQIREITEEIENFIHQNRKPSKYYVTEFSDATIEEFKKAVDALNRAYIYAQRIDYLVSDDDSEESFHERLIEDLEAMP